MCLNRRPFMKRVIIKFWYLGLAVLNRSCSCAPGAFTTRNQLKLISISSVEERG